MNRVGKILIASPTMPDVNFRRAVVVITKDDKDGAMGFILNHPTGDPLSKIWSELKIDEEIKTDCDEPLYKGGPVFGPLSAIHTYEEWGEQKIGDNIYWSAEGDNLIQVVNAGDPFKFFMGYTGWTKDQLDYETKCGGWIDIPVDKKYLFFQDPPGMYEKNVWNTALRDWGCKQWQSFGIKHIPDDIKSN